MHHWASMNKALNGPFDFIPVLFHAHMHSGINLFHISPMIPNELLAKEHLAPAYHPDQELLSA
jgi:hypothetical protein